MGLSPRTHQLAERLRQLIRKVVPEVEEAGYPGWKLIGYRYRRYFCFIAPQTDRVCLGFEHGISLPDPDGLLEGTGKQVRYVVIRSAKDLRVAPLKKLIQLAALRAFHD